MPAPAIFCGRARWRARDPDGDPEERSERDRFGNLQRLGVLDISGPINAGPHRGIVPGSAAAAAGFQPEDRVRKIDGKAVNTFLDLREVVAPTRIASLSSRSSGRRTSCCAARPASTRRKMPRVRPSGSDNSEFRGLRSSRHSLHPVRRARGAQERH
jgi:hypothetical protein